MTPTQKTAADQNQMPAPPFSASPRPRLPGDLPTTGHIARMVRVDHAGEYGAVRIYAGQLAVLRDRKSGSTIAHMAEQEAEHLATFERELAERRVRPTALLPLWHVAGFALGAGTALLGERAAMACTVAVEEVIDAHYAKQIDCLEADDSEPDLRQTFAQFRADEQAHRDTGLSHGAEETPLFTPLTGAIKAGTRLAIWLSERF